MLRRLCDEEVKLGTLTSTVADGSCWWTEDEFPSSQLWADEVERVLSFAEVKGIFGAQLGDLKGNAKQRNAALNEIRVAYFFDRNSFPLLEWEPEGKGASKGEFWIGGPNAEEIFVEVKGPSWEGELWDFGKKDPKELSPTEMQVITDRIKKEKHINAECRFFDNSEAIKFAIDKAYDKFMPGHSNLLIVADDLFVSLEHDPDLHFAKKALYRTSEGYFACRRFECLGGVGCFWVKNNGKAIWYEMNLFLNPGATQNSELPEPFWRAFEAYSP